MWLSLARTSSQQFEGYQFILNRRLYRTSLNELNDSLQLQTMIISVTSLHEGRVCVFVWVLGVQSSILWRISIPTVFCSV